MVYFIKNKEDRRTFKVCPFCHSRSNCIHFICDDLTNWIYKDKTKEEKEKKGEKKEKEESDKITISQLSLGSTNIIDNKRKTLE